jgi:hypothetical protein
MSKNKPTNKKATPKAKKPNGRKTWLKVAGKVHELNKKQNLGWTWSESMRFASKKVYPKFKGKSVSKVALKDIELDFKNALAEGQPPMPTPTPKRKEICFSALDVPLEDLIEREWFSISDDDVWLNFDSNLPMRFAFDGILDTGIIKKGQMPDMKYIREEMRKIYGNVSPAKEFIFKILLQPNKEADEKPCSYYILVTIEDSSFDSETAGQEVTISKSIKDLTKEEQEKRLLRDEERKKQKREKEKRRKAEARQKPKEVEPKSITKTKATPKDESSVELEKIKLLKSRGENLKEVLEILRKDFKDGVLTKRQYLQRQKQVLDNFEQGGEIK